MRKLIGLPVLLLLAAARVAAAEDQSPLAAPACEVYKISGPTVIAFFEYEGCQNRPNCEDALDDFQIFLQDLRSRLDDSTISIHECYRASFEVEVRDQRKRVGQKSVGYYLVTPDKEPRVELGVITDEDLVQLMNQYFGRDVVNKALRRPTTNLPVEWTSLLSEFAAHDAEGKGYVTSKAKGATDPRARALASALLVEWDLAVHTERLKHPLLVHEAKPQADDKRVRIEIFQIRVEVGEDGRVLSAKFTTPPGQTDLGGEVLQAAEASLFRPAFKDGRFVRAELELDYTVHVK